MLDTWLRFRHFRAHIFEFIAMKMFLGNWQRHRPHCARFPPKYASQGNWQRHRLHFVSLAPLLIPKKMAEVYPQFVSLQTGPNPDCSVNSICDLPMGLQDKESQNNDSQFETVPGKIVSGVIFESRFLSPEKAL